LPNLKESVDSEVIEETIVRFENEQIPQGAEQKSTKLAAVCCPSFSL